MWPAMWHHQATPGQGGGAAGAGPHHGRVRCEACSYKALGTMRTKVMTARKGGSPEEAAVSFGGGGASARAGARDGRWGRLLLLPGSPGDQGNPDVDDVVDESSQTESSTPTVATSG
ncbi:hypothetical protein PR202_gb17272 [Eleusine coracana subsp. coracana]|uniref:Uncharacterized protein n=1 Tax=Eleusine coracana subsp. coracana TaxID=191504 RepID=A0AAV5F3W2_ELECO|nr:hypothetical protein PR202_gb17272 [Eleusine coracana subsp. coracana]